MNERYPSRREAMADTIEQGEKYKAMQTLLELGVCKKVSDLELYHGRAGRGEAWRVDPSYDNAGNNTGNRNVNKIPALNTGEYNIAREFSEARVSVEGGTPEVHRIISNDPDAMVIASDIFELSKRDREKALGAISVLCPNVMDGAPITISGGRKEFRERTGLIGRLSPRSFKNKYGLMFEDEVSSIERETGLERDLVVHIGSAINTQKLLRNGGLVALCGTFVNSSDTMVSVETEHDGIKDLPFSREYLSSWLRSSHIVGIISHGDQSATLGRNIDVCRFFDLTKVNTPEAIKDKERSRNQVFGKIATAMGERSQRTESELLQALKSNLYIKPQEIVRIARRTPGFDEVFEADAGNWEGFKLAEHTETVLRVFDDNYADYIPASTLPVIRLALLVHDIGKPEAVRRGDKKNQKQYNVAYAKKFMQLNNIDGATSELVLSMIGEGMSFTSEMIANRGSIVSKWRLMNYCERIAKKYLDTDQVDRETIVGFRNILEILQTCDSAAYTTMAITRAQNNVRYRNYGSFDSSFEGYTGFTGRRARLKKH